MDPQVDPSTSRSVEDEVAQTLPAYIEFLSSYVFCRRKRKRSEVEELPQNPTEDAQLPSPLPEENGEHHESKRQKRLPELERSHESTLNPPPGGMFNILG